MKFGGLVAIGDLSFQAQRGDITALIGPNGAGKTTVFNCVTGFYKPSEGMITFDTAASLLERLPAEIPATRQGGAHLPEHPAILGNDAAGERHGRPAQHAHEGVGIHGARPVRLHRYRKASAESIELAKHWLEKANLIDRADDPAGDLPYGAQRRLEIARAMCTGPESALPRRTCGRTQSKRVAGAERTAHRHQGDTGHFDPAHRARHVGRDADFRPCRRAGIRPQDFGR